MNDRPEDVEVLKGEYRAIYPYFDRHKWHHSYGTWYPPLVRDRSLGKDYFTQAAKVVGEALRQQMADVLNTAKGTRRSVAKRNDWLDDLARALRSWLPFVSYAPFVTLEGEYGPNEWVPAPPDLPPEVPPTGIPEPPDLGPDPYRTVRPTYEKTRESQVLLRQWKIQLAAFVSWQVHVMPAAPNDPKQLAISSYPGGVKNGGELKARLYADYPLLLLLRNPVTPAVLVDILEQPVEERRKQLESLIDDVTQKYQESIDVFGKRLEAGDWHLLGPVLAAAKWSLMPTGLKDDDPLARKFDGWARDMAPTTVQDLVLYGSLALSAAIFAATGGLAAVALTAFIDVSTTGLNTYLNHLDNVDKSVMRRFALIDSEFDVASPDKDLTTDAAFMALSYLVPFGGGAAVRLTRRVVQSKIGRIEGALVKALKGPVDPRMVKGSRGTVEVRPSHARGSLPEPSPRSRATEKSSQGTRNRPDDRPEARDEGPGGEGTDGRTSKSDVPPYTEGVRPFTGYTSKELRDQAYRTLYGMTMGDVTIRKAAAEMIRNGEITIINAPGLLSPGTKAVYLGEGVMKINTEKIKSSLELVNTVVHEIEHHLQRKAGTTPYVEWRILNELEAFNAAFDATRTDHRSLSRVVGDYRHKVMQNSFKHRPEPEHVDALIEVLKELDDVEVVRGARRRKGLVVD